MQVPRPAEERFDQRQQASRIRMAPASASRRGAACSRAHRPSGMPVPRTAELEARAAISVAADDAPTAWPSHGLALPRSIRSSVASPTHWRREPR